jgi:hypothetical protein
MFEKEHTMVGPVLETARASVLSRELHLQMQVGNCVEALMLLETGVRDDSVMRVIKATAERLSEGAEDLSGSPRTVEQTASAVGVLQAANLALLSEERTGTSSVLKDMAKALDAATSNDAPMSDTAALIQQLVSLHSVLAGLTGLQPDEVHGLGRSM